MTRSVSLTRPIRRYTPLPSAAPLPVAARFAESADNSTQTPKEKKLRGTTHPHHPTPPYGRGVGVVITPAASNTNNTARKRVQLNTDEDVNLANMSVEQKRELMARLSLDLQESQPARDSDMWAVALSKALADAIGGSVGAGGSIHTLKRTAASGAAFTPVLDFMHSSSLIKQPVTSRVGVYHLLAELVVAHARRISRHTGAPLGAKLLSTCQANVTALFEQEFPGYLRAGLAALVAKRMAVARG